MTDPDVAQRQEVTFRSGGIDCAADLYLRNAPGPHPSLVLGHGYNMTKEGLRNEGRYLSEAGYNVMIIDYRTFGMSGGEPRGQMFPRRQVEDLRNAITYFSRRPEVDADRVGLYGVSYAGGLALQTAAFDQRVKVCAVQSPIVNGREWMRGLRSGLEWDGLLTALQQDFEARYDADPRDAQKVNYSGPGGLPVPEALFAAMGPMDPDNPNSCAYAAECQKSFDPMIVLESTEHIIDFNPSDVIEWISPRPLMIIGNGGGPYDWIHPPEAIQKAFVKAGEPKELVFLPYDAFGLYQEPGRGAAMGAAIAFFDKHLKET
jgi:hypothetical protein